MGLYIKIPNVTFKNYIGIAEIEDDPIIPDVPVVPDEPDTPDVPSHTHSVTHVAAKAATTTAAGNIEYWYCAGCNTYWSDASLTNEITQAETVIPKLEEPEITPNIDPVSNIKGLYYFDKATVQGCIANQVEGGVAPQMPTNSSFACNGDYATFTGTMLASRISSNIFKSKPENGMTLVALFRVPSDVEAFRSIFSTLQKAEQKGVVFTNNRAYGYFDGTGGALSLNYNQFNNSNNFAIYAFSATPNGVRVVKSVSDDQITELLNADNIADNWTCSGGVTIGGGQLNVGFNADADIALVSIYEGGMADDQLKQIFAYVRAYGEQKGLTIE